jgi:hypothetical protein
MKRRAGGTAPGTDPGDAMEVMSGATAAGAGPTSYASSGDSGAGGAELLEDRTLRLSGGGHGRRFGLSLPGAVVGSFLVAALALGAAFGPMAGDPASDTGSNGDAAYSEPTDKVDGEVQPDKTAGADEPQKTDDASEPDKTAAPDGPDTTTKPEPTEAPAPDAKALEIAVALDGTAVVVEWSACEVDGFVAYKVIRSKDEWATWPLGAGDSLAAAIGDASTTRFVDKDVDGGRTYVYRVVGLREWNGETVVGCSTKYAVISVPAPTPKPEPTAGDGAALALTVVIKEGHPFIDWSACTGVDFDYYKVVRSLDATVTWPVGDNDSKVAAVGKDGDTKAWDISAPGGKKVYYRVFCIREKDGGGSVAVAASVVKGVTTPETEPAPDPVALGFEVDVTGEGVVLHWEGCSSDVFAFYKVVRSFTNQNPSYLPGTDGSQVIGVIENRNVTQLTDGAVESGDTIYYRVQAIGYWYGQKILLGQTTVITVTIP